MAYLIENKNNASTKVLIEEKDMLQSKIAADSLDFKEVVMYCKKTMKLQDEDIRRLEEIVEMNQRLHDQKMLERQQKNNEELEEVKKQLNLMQQEHLLMLTQIGNQQQMKLEMVEMQKELESLKKELAAKDEKLNLKEIREREIMLLTEKKVRSELLKEFEYEVEKIARELKIQNAAQIEANNHIINKLNKEIAVLKQKLEEKRLKVVDVSGELVQSKKEISLLENDKKRLEEHLQRAGQQTEKLLKDGKKQLEETEKLRTKDNTKNLEVIAALRKDISQVKKDLKLLQSTSAEQAEGLKRETDLREKTLLKHMDQNRKLKDLQDFLKIILEDNDDDYVDAMFGENRVAVFAKLSMLLQRIPLVQ